jgi:plasmid stability protein
MGDFLVRDLDELVLKRLKWRAEQNGSSLQQEIKKAIALGAAPTPEERRAVIEELHRLWGDRPPLTVSAADIIREMREEET